MRWLFGAFQQLERHRVIDERSSKIDGWKAISSYFGKDRSTVMRWAREHDLPIHRVPGGKSGSVLAYRSELEAWSKSTMDGGFLVDVSEHASSASRLARQPITPLIWIAGGVALLVLGLSTLVG